MFKDQYPATYRAAVAYRREEERRERIKRSLLEAIGWTMPEPTATADAMSVKATEAVADTNTETKTCGVPSLRLDIADVSRIDVRIRRDGDALIVAIDLDGDSARQADRKHAS
ncbi:hypothetical protein [Bosea sp. (in: a-proteobacteria)]|uniref:hypothetical protein n=1 Tax=Bosea sp. (in: a-proteobacteria) TaxID=1871050 RepID=UPI003B3AFA09